MIVAREMADLFPENRVLQDFQQLFHRRIIQELFLDDQVEPLFQQRDEVQLLDLPGDPLRADGQIRLPRRHGGGHGQMGLHDLIIAPDLRRGDAQPLQIHFQSEPELLPAFLHVTF